MPNSPAYLLTHKTCKNTYRPPWSNNGHTLATKPGGVTPPRWGDATERWFPRAAEKSTGIGRETERARERGATGREEAHDLLLLSSSSLDPDPPWLASETDNRGRGGTQPPSSSSLPARRRPPQGIAAVAEQQGGGDSNSTSSGSSSKQQQRRPQWCGPAVAGADGGHPGQRRRQ
ncbi:hypothetical protein Taro_007578 [Colocasia esculenta]|uniref:Uncharacterized protein n=1 Tax=Colocasia esculenta TaxID=4460 RepID=A0A843TVS2_COLES|nr:hypothetical protein [Colocasia esculenta]